MKLVYIFLCLLFLSACKKESAEVTFWKVQDPSVMEERIAVLMDKQPNLLNILVKADTDAPFQIIARGTADNKTYQFKGGPIDTVLSDYWKSPICRASYIPKGVKSGDVNICVLLYSDEK